MGLHLQDIDQLLEPSLTDDLEMVGVAELRARRDECQRCEFALSYVRRVFQGQLDIVLAELEARGKGERGDLGRLVEDLPSILAGHNEATSSSGREHEPALTMAGVAAQWIEQLDPGVDDLVSDVLSEVGTTERSTRAELPGANLGTLSNEELSPLAELLSLAEASVSARRRALHDQIDRFQKAIVARYKAGAADIDSLLN
jgi:uncharacterized small protein (DUF1192 family)